MCDLDTLYSPSKWSKRLPEDIIVQKHVQVLAEDSKKARTEIPATLNIPYGSSARECMDIFGCDLPEDAPVLIFIHGGYWQEPSCTHDIHASVARGFYNDGIKTITIGYEICPKLTIPEIIIQIEKAVQKSLEYAKLCKSRGVILSGHCAGATLIALYFINSYSKLSKEDQNIIKHAFLLVGIYDLTPIIDTYLNVPLKLSHEAAEDISPLLKELPKNIKASFFVVLAKNDSPAFKDQGKEFNEKLVKNGIKSEEMLVDADHFNLLENLGDPESQLTRKMREVILST